VSVIAESRTLRITYNGESWLCVSYTSESHNSAYHLQRRVACKICRENSAYRLQRGVVTPRIGDSGELRLRISLTAGSHVWQPGVTGRTLKASPCPKRDNHAKNQPYMYRTTQDGQFKHLKNMGYLRLIYRLAAINDSRESIFWIFKLEYLRELEEKKRKIPSVTN
jgi:hypothetical protein